ncbi:MAG: tetratricopeptide repeat protein [Gemmatimonadetes bacterium]|nr:tetratricopeptide repeat protein [Gemmatimonadota bacterium]
MATSARIDELRKKFDENPRRYFAPYANEFRKQGDLSQAIALCRTHLPNQPGHISGHIVLAQALYESRELAESRGVFEQALDLDPENLIALRYLGDIAREQGAPAAASAWYQRVLEADPRNDEIRELIRVVGVEAADALTALSRQPTPVSNSIVPATGEVADETWNAHPEGGLDWVDAQPAASEPEVIESLATPLFGGIPTHQDLGELEAVAEPEHTDWFSAAPEASAVQHDDPFPEFPAALSEAAAPLAARTTPEEVLAAVAPDLSAFSLDLGAVAEGPLPEGPSDNNDAIEVASVEAKAPEVGSGYESPQFVALDANEAAYAAEDSPATIEDLDGVALDGDEELPAPAVVAEEVQEEVEFESMFEEVSLPAAAPAASNEIDLEAAISAEHDAVIEHRVDDAVDAVSAEYDPAIGRTPAFSAPVSEEPPAPFVTETMAELYLQQGFDEEALAIYRQLLAQNPSDEILQARVASLEVGVRAPTITPLTSPAQEPTGPSVRDFFSAIALRGVTPADAAPAPTEALEPAAVRTTPSYSGVARPDEALTQPDAPAMSAGGLASMFRGQDPSEADESAALGLAGAFGVAAAPVAPELSLDTLFGQLPSAQADAVTSAVREGSSEPSDPLAPGPDGEANADIEQFTAWLEGLKKK